MSCSTTCKALFACAAALAMLCSCALAQDDPPPERAQALLVYDAANAAIEWKDIERMSMMMTAMGKSLAFGDIADFVDTLSRYEYVICYRLEEIDRREMEAIRGCQSRLLILGSDFMKRYLIETNRRELIVRESDLDRGVLRYAFSAEAAFEEIVSAENVALFASQEEGGGTLAVENQEYPFFSRVGNVWFTPVTSLSAALTQAALIQEMTNWMWPYRDAPPAYGQYLVLDEIYPFMDAQMLMDRVQALADEGIPYVLSVMPIYKNASYPAMVQFCQVLQYAQQNGGFVIMHAPIIQSVTQDAQALYAALTDALTAYTDNGVYPLGIEAPVSWTNDDFYLNILRRYRTVFVYNGGEYSAFTPQMGANRLHDNDHQLVMPVIGLDKTGVSHLTCYPSAIYLNAYETTPEQIRELVRILKSERVPLHNLWEMNHSVWTEEMNLRSEGRMVYLNEELMRLAYEPAGYDEDYDYHRDFIDRITVSLKNQNKMLIALTAVIVAVFAAFMVYLRRLNRRSFFYGGE